VTLPNELQTTILKVTGKPAPDPSNVIEFQRWLVTLRKEHRSLFDQVAMVISSAIVGN
jgi:hypothetical protein